MVLLGGEVDLVAVVRPRTELHRAKLIVERKPANVNGARRDERRQRMRRRTIRTVRFGVLDWLFACGGLQRVGSTVDPAGLACRNEEGARRDEQSEWNPIAAAVGVDDDVRRKLAVNILVGAAVE